MVAIFAVCWRLDGYLAWLVSETETKLQADWIADAAALAQTLERLLVAAGEWIDGNKGVCDAINQSARQLAVNIVVPHRDAIADYVCGPISAVTA